MLLPAPAVARPAVTSTDNNVELVQFSCDTHHVAPPDPPALALNGSGRTSALPADREGTRR
ncbi:hypothetical protein WDV06_33240 [Streptomyces racemochromogenes]|uniref:Uncharacterized protein n=1 Tax=Streptomyces racemochromogenes TaxID=67353 RepID=A0ABW7PNC9_9ACTN